MVRKYDGCIVTMTATPDYAEMFQKFCLPTWEPYAARHRFEIIQLTNLIDDSPRARARHPSWQKLLIRNVPAVRTYDKVVWIDADVVMNKAADIPNICENFGEGQIAAVPGQWFFKSPIATNGFAQVCGKHESLYHYNAALLKASGFDQGPGPWTCVYNAGVFAFHKPDWNKWAEVYDCEGGQRYGEQLHISHRLGNVIANLDPRFNTEWYTLKHTVYDFCQRTTALLSLAAKQALKMTWFLHFNGNQEDLPLLYL